MAIRVQCPSCKTMLQVPSEFADKRVACTVCKQVLIVPALSGSAPSPSMAAAVSAIPPASKPVHPQSPPPVDDANLFAIETQPTAPHKSAPVAGAKKSNVATPRHKKLLWAGLGSGIVAGVAVVVVVIVLKSQSADPRAKNTPLRPRPNPTTKREKPALASSPQVLTSPKSDTPPETEPMPKVEPAPPKPAPAVWLEEIDVAKRQAAKEFKDVLVSFKGSDWCPPCQQLEQEVFSRPDFIEKAGRRFVLVKVDFPRSEAAKALIKNATANEKLQSEFGVSSYPTVILLDPSGIPYGQLTGYLEGGVDPYFQDLEQLQAIRRQRDELLAAIDQAKGVAKLDAAKNVSRFLLERKAIANLRHVLPGWRKLAEELDADNRAGYVEWFCDLDWELQFATVPTEKLKSVLTDIEQWKARYGELKNRERAASLWLLLARGKAELGEFEGAFKCIEESKKLKPQDPRTQMAVQNPPLALGLGTGTGFAVTDAGHFVTNAHVAGGPGKVFVLLGDSQHPIAAELIAEDSMNDLALIRIELPKNRTIAPLCVLDNHMPRRGEEVGAWGYPLGTLLGQGLKLTKGGVSGLPEEANRNMLVLDVKINPGNSGGPLCNVRGNVIGVVTAKTLSFAPQGQIESYGMAVTSERIARFLKEKLPEFKPPPPGVKDLRWEEIDQRVSPAVAMILKARPAAKPALFATSIGKQYDVPADGLKLPGQLKITDPIDVVNGQTTNCRCQVFLVKMQKDRKYKIVLTSTQLDPFLRIEDPSGRHLVEDDDSGGNRNARLIFAPPTDGVYRLIATHYDNRLGVFDLELQILR